MKKNMNNMLITDKKIEVTHQMMVDANMTRMTPQGFQYGIPVDPKDKSKGLRWVSLEIEDTESSDWRQCLQ